MNKEEIEKLKSLKSFIEGYGATAINFRIDELFPEMKEVEKESQGERA